MTIRDTVATVFTEVAQQQNRTLAPLADHARLIDLGLDSLCMAVIIARLEDQLGFDPFSAGEAVANPDTFGEFVALYAHEVAA